MSYMTKMSNIVRYEGDPRVIRSGPSSLPAVDRWSKALGWFSLLLGAAELLAPKSIARSLGMEGKEGLLRTYGVREIGAGIMTLSTEKQMGVWSRVVGDGLDIATLVASRDRANPKSGNIGIALALVLGITALDLIVAQAATASHSRRRGEQRLYGDRSGFPRGVEAVRGAARA